MIPKDEQQRLVKTTANKGRQRKAKPKKPPGGKLGDWTIPMPLTPAELDKLSLALADGTLQIRRLNREIDDIKDAAKRRIKDRTEQIETLEEETEEQARKREAGTEDREVRCWRAVEGDETVYYDPSTGEELHRHRAKPGEQQGLFGGTPTGKRSGLDEMLARARALRLPDVERAPEPDEKTEPWPWGPDSWHPFVLARQLETRAELDPYWNIGLEHELLFKELVPGDLSQLISTCGAYQVRREGTVDRGAFGVGEQWVALHGEEKLWDKNLGDTYPDSETAQQRCRDCAATVAEGKRLAAEARAIQRKGGIGSSQRDKRPEKAERTARPSFLARAFDPGSGQRDTDIGKPALLWECVETGHHYGENPRYFAGLYRVRKTARAWRPYHNDAPIASPLSTLRAAKARCQAYAEEQREKAEQ